MNDRTIGQVIAGRAVQALPGSATVVEAARRMVEARVGALLVVDGERLLGIFTERDALARVLAKGADPARLTLAEVMTPKPITIGAERLLAHALILMHENGCRHMPVLDGGRVAGVVSMRDALGSEMTELDGHLDRLEQIAAEMR